MTKKQRKVNTESGLREIDDIDDIDGKHQIDDFVAHLARIIAKTHARKLPTVKPSANPKNMPRNGKN